ncbi:MAG: transglycosylase SLT domain-containing protein [Myxococcales bacterium]|nr:transglycosylase SLT domain-containing protein [Myxococcales bacterium]
MLRSSPALLSALLLGLLQAGGESTPALDAGLKAQVERSEPAPSAATSGSTAAGPGPKRFDPASARLADDSPEQKALRALAEADDAARAAARQELQTAFTGADSLGRGRLLWLLAEFEDDVLLRRGHLRALYQSDHPLSRWAGLRLATAMVAQTPAAAAAIADGLASGWAGAGRARALSLEAALRFDADAAVPKLRARLRTARDDDAASDLALPLARLLEGRRNREAKLEALALYRRVLSRAPLSDVAAEAERAAEQLLSRLPRKLRRQHRQLLVDDALALGRALSTGGAHGRAETVLSELLSRLKPDDGLRCQVELEIGRTLVRRRLREKAIAHMERLLEQCRDRQVRTWARYYGGRARLRTGDPKGASDHYQALVAYAPGSSLADDALFMLAVAQADMGQEAERLRTLERLVTDYPDGDMHAEAGFMLAFDARRAGRHADALRHLDALIARGGGERAEGTEGRAAYWRARSLQALGRRDEAIEGFAAVAAAHPLSYHAQQALARLGELAPERVTDLLAALQVEPEALEPLSFPWRASMDEAAFRSALLLAQVGELGLCERELRHLGAFRRGADPELRWAAAAMINRAGGEAEASRLVRGRLWGALSRPPQGHLFHLWRIAFPEAFAPLIENAAAEAQVPAPYVRAVAREESAFDPEAVSRANAYGLIQLIVPTARAHAKPLGLPSHAAALIRPEVNLRIGSRFIRTLWERYHDNPAVVPAAYNAGHGAADRWLREAKDKPLDEWIEAIPYRETRRYTRRVLQSYGIYSFLGSGKLPPLPARLPVDGAVARAAGG